MEREGEMREMCYVCCNEMRNFFIYLLYLVYESFIHCIPERIMLVVASR